MLYQKWIYYQSIIKVFDVVCVCVSPHKGKGEQSYPDLLALLIALLVTVIVALGVKNSVGFNNALNVINLIVWVFMMIAGLFFVNGENWDEGRFLPFGWSGVGMPRKTQKQAQSIDIVNQ